MAAAVRKWAIDDGLMVKRKKELWVRTANALAAILVVCGFFRWGFPITMWGLPFAVFFAFTVRSWADGVGTRRTPAGRQLWSQAGGFHRLLSTDSAETRFDFGARKDLYSAYVPFAVAAGAAALWAKKYRDTTGDVAPQPDWYNSSSTTGSSGFAGALGRTEFRQFRIGVVVVDRRIHRVAVLVVLVRRRRRVQRRWWRRWRWRRRRLVVSSLLILVLVVAGAGAHRLRGGLQQDSHRRRPGVRGAVRHRRGADAARLADPEPGAHRADLRRPTRGASSITSPTPARR